MTTAPDETATRRLGVNYTRSGDRVVKLIDTHVGSFESTRKIVRAEEDLAAAWATSYLHGVPIEHPNGTRGRITYAELFCGSGGLALGFKEAAAELGIVAESEACLDHDPEAVAVYAANHGSRVRSAKSASEIVDGPPATFGPCAEFLYEPELLDPAWAKLIGKVNVLLAGPPCQGHSNLNNRTRRTDRRNELYLTVPATAVALGVDVVIIENVEAVVHDRSRVVETTRSLLERSGYTVDTGVVAATRLGWPQTRRRYFMVARRSTAPLGVKETLDALTVPSIRDVMWAIGDLEKVPFDDRLHICTELSPENRQRIDFLFDNDRYDLPNSERPDCHKDGTSYGSVYGRMHPGKPAPTVTTGFLTPGRGRYIHPHLRRTITPHEAARIQGYPDGYNFFVNPRNPPTKSKLTKWIGDAVPMPLGYTASLAALAADPFTFSFRA
jgi:DNA (cytosine-5)-methyltransferase 1